jgi:antitoxin VapB
MVEKAVNLKNAEAYRIASRVARLTGESMTEAVTVPPRERLSKVEKPACSSSLAGDLMAIGADCASRLGRRTRRLDHAALLYDAKGLPR